ncbi:MAG: DUF4278 domain-containing protein [Fischerella sp. CENA71]|nr:DUF4278 domain-containing protein [Fischerella sp. CENA71]
MKLYYRGQSYEYDPSKVKTQKTQLPFQAVPKLGRAYNLMYRGVTYHVNGCAKSAKVPQPPTAYKLIYRGIIHFVHRTAQGKFTVITQPAST